MPSLNKPPLGAPERIRETAPARFDRCGAPDAGTPLISAEMSGGSGNLHHRCHAGGGLTDARLHRVGRARVERAPAGPAAACTAA